MLKTELKEKFVRQEMARKELSMLELCKIFRRRRELEWERVDDQKGEPASSSRSEITQVSGQSAAQQSETRRDNSPSPKTARVVLLVAKKYPNRSGNGMCPQVSHATAASRSSFSELAEDEPPVVAVEVNTASLNGACQLQAAAEKANCDQEIPTKGRYLMSPKIKELTRRRNEGNPNLASDRPSNPQRMPQAQGRTVKSVNRTETPLVIHEPVVTTVVTSLPPIQKPAITTVASSHALSHPSAMSGRRLGRQEICREELEKGRRRQGVCTDSDCARAERTFARVLRKRF